MSFPVLPHGFLGAQGDSDTYRIERSLRFNSADSAYLNRTPASDGNRKTWTWSGWVKRSGLTGTRQGIFAATNAAGTIYWGLEFNASEQLNVFDSNAGGGTNVASSSVYRDISSWYHVLVAIDTTQATASNRTKLYVNGSEVTSFSASNYPTQNSDTYVNSAVSHSIGSWLPSSGLYFSGYLAEINFIDGQALTPSSFGETDAITGRWKAKAYSGTYGTNGFYLKFADNSGTTATTLGKDSSPNGNNWTPNNFSVTAGAGNDSLVDSPTNYGSDTGLGGEVRGNYATWNSLTASVNGTISNGNLEFAKNSSGFVHPRSSIYVSIGKWYSEFTLSATSDNIGSVVGIMQEQSTGYVGFSPTSYAYRGSGDKFNNDVSTSYGSSFTTNDIIGIALDLDAGTIVFYKNGVSQGTAFSSISGSFAFSAGWYGTLGTSTWIANFGQRPFAYTAPSGFKALCTQNLPQPTIQKPSTAMDVVTYTGNSGTQTISSLGFSPDLVWMKNRTASADHAIYDTLRTAMLSSNQTAAEVPASNVLTYSSNGFAVGGSDIRLNTASNQYVAWSWDAGSTNSTNTSGSITSTVRANPQAGFSVVSYTGNGSAATIGHGLGATPKMIIAKTRSTTGDWVVGHASLDSSSPWGYYIFLSSTAARNSAGAINSWGNNTVVVPPTSTVFSVGNGANLNSNGITYIAYCFSEVEGYSKFGSYVGNGSADGPFVYCGFRPRWVMLKAFTASSVEQWWIIDTSRSPFNLCKNNLAANSSGAEQDGVASNRTLDILSNGFKLRDIDAGFNYATYSYIYAAFAESAFKYSRAR